jgi:acetylornithine/N-succinyldiaminopimelate aminotransferase
MQGIRKLCDEKGLLLLIDEIQTGWCRTGEVMGYMNYGIKPDIVTMAKGIGGGMPIGAMCATAKVAAAYNPGSHGTTFGGNPVCCAAAYAQVKELLDNKLAQNAREVGNYFMEKLKSLPRVKEVRGMGLLVGVEFDFGGAADIKHHCIDKKLLVTAIGTTIIRMVPPLIATKKNCDEAYDILKEAVLEAAK